MEWQPIETAPKDADCVLLWAHGWGIQPGWWDAECGGHWRSCETQMLTGGWFDVATHWCAFPAPPQEGD